jgi:hypothetical protein
MRELVARTTITVCYWKRREERLRQPTGTIGWDTVTGSRLAMEVLQCADMRDSVHLRAGTMYASISAKASHTPIMHSEAIDHGGAYVQDPH